MECVGHVGHRGILQSPLHGHAHDIAGSKLGIGQTPGHRYVKCDPVITIAQQVQCCIQRHGHSLGKNIITFCCSAAQSQAVNRHGIAHIKCIAIDGDAGVDTESPTVYVVSGNVG